MHRAIDGVKRLVTALEVDDGETSMAEACVRRM
jgi:hypothetical protein